MKIILIVICELSRGFDHFFAFVGAGFQPAFYVGKERKLKLAATTAIPPIIHRYEGEGAKEKTQYYIKGGRDYEW